MSFLLEGSRQAAVAFESTARRRARKKKVNSLVITLGCLYTRPGADTTGLFG